MNAQEIGKQHGFAEILSYREITKPAFEKIARHHAERAYKNVQKQAEYLQGFMSNWWQEPHPAGCACVDCQNAEDILTY